MLIGSNEAGQQNFRKIRIPYLLRFYCPLWTRITTCVAYASQSIGKAKRIVDTCVWQRRNRTGVLIVERRGGRKRGKGGQIRESREKKGGERLQFAEPRCETRQLSDGEEREREKKKSGNTDEKRNGEVVLRPRITRRPSTNHGKNERYYLDTNYRHHRHYFNFDGISK